jgi:hypothetical protein
MDTTMYFINKQHPVVPQGKVDWGNNFHLTLRSI